MADQKRSERVVVLLTPDEKQLLDALSGDKSNQYVRDLIFQELSAGDQVFRQFYALGMTLNESLAVLIDEVEGQVPDQCTHQLRALREAVKALQQQAYTQQTDIPEILRQLHDAVGGNRLAQLEKPKRPTVNPRALENFRHF
jgi:hypothetical protein